MSTMTSTAHPSDPATATGRPRVRKRDATRAVLAPSADQRAPVWDRPVPLVHNATGDPRPPLLWLLGAHGGAGVTTLARLLAPAADCARRWPAPAAGESPYVLVVARETAIGLAAADALLRQHHAGLAGDSEVVGLVTVAARPGRMPAGIRRDRDLYSGLVEHLWRVEWHETWMLARHSDLPIWRPGDPEPAKSRRDDELATAPTDIRTLGVDLVEAITALHARRVRDDEGEEYPL
ncbi:MULTISPECIES: DUF6668 family protein [Nocardia]|uniref:DUF6668 family protein n=1 Tax=Nocardia TaxID=1817 RepID=UPI001E3F659F|nr:MULTISPECIES: DUF6668 family protein [Nocardia]